MKYKKGDIIKIKNYPVKGKYGQLDKTLLGKLTIVPDPNHNKFFEPFKVEIIGNAREVYLEEQEIQCKIKDNKLNRKLYKQLFKDEYEKNN